MKAFSPCEVKVIDFGSCMFLDDDLTDYVQSRPYRAPEVVLGLPYGQKIDLWSLGCIIAELWTGSVLFQSDSVNALLARIVGIIGPMPAHMMTNGRCVSQYFLKSGLLYQDVDEGMRPSSAGQQRGQQQIHILLPKASSLKHRLRTNDAEFLDFLTSLLKVDPAERGSASEAMKHP